MPTLSTGYVIVGAYAIKIRRTLFAQQKDRIKNKELDGKEIARASGELNKVLFDILVNKLSLDRGDMVRVRIDYEISNGMVKWNYDTIRIDAFKRIDENEIKSKIEEAIKSIRSQREESAKYEIKSIGKTELDDVIYEIRLNGEEIGLIIATPIDSETLIRGALIEPKPVEIEKTKVGVSGDNLESYLSEHIAAVINNAKEISEEKAKETIENAKKLIS